MITDGQSSFAIFIYQCEAVLDATNAVVGFNAGGDVFHNYQFDSPSDLTCFNAEDGISNIVYPIGFTSNAQLYTS